MKIKSYFRCAQIQRNLAMDLSCFQCLCRWSQKILLFCLMRLILRCAGVWWDNILCILHVLCFLLRWHTYPISYLHTYRWRRSATTWKCRLKVVTVFQFFPPFHSVLSFILSQLIIHTNSPAQEFTLSKALNSSTIATSCPTRSSMTWCWRTWTKSPWISQMFLGPWRRLGGFLNCGCHKKKASKESLAHFIYMLLCVFFFIIAFPLLIFFFFFFRFISMAFPSPACSFTCRAATALWLVCALTTARFV